MRKIFWMTPDLCRDSEIQREKKLKIVRENSVLGDTKNVQRD